MTPRDPAVERLIRTANQHFPSDERDQNRAYRRLQRRLAFGALGLALHAVLESAKYGWKSFGTGAKLAVSAAACGAGIVASHAGSTLVPRASDSGVPKVTVLTDGTAPEQIAPVPSGSSTRDAGARAQPGNEGAPTAKSTGPALVPPSESAAPARRQLTPPIVMPDSVVDRESGLGVESALLRRAHSALHAGRLSDAEWCVDTHRRDHPAGQLRAEFAAVAVIIQCKRAPARGLQLAQQYASKWSGSTSIGAVQQACLGASGPETPGE